MKRIVCIIGLWVFAFLIVIPAFAQPITLDGDSADWIGISYVRAINNPDGYFPEYVRAIINDTVDIKDTRIYVDEDRLYAFIRTWAEIWPNRAKQKIVNGVLLQRSRGYYHILVDLDNDRTTGWDPSYFEANYTTLGYLISQGVYNTDQTIGVELIFDTGIKCIYSHEDTLSPEEEKGALPYSIINWAGDYSAYDGELDIGSESDIFEYRFHNYKELTYEDGFIIVMDDLIAEGAASGIDTSLRYFGGHAFGIDFLEWGTSVTPLRDYFFSKDSVNYFKEGNTFAFCSQIETPQDDWGVDTSPRGEFIVATSSALIRNSEEISKVVDRFELGNNFPNPFNPITTITYKVPETSHVSIVIYNALSQKVRILVNDNIQQGTHHVKWNGRNDEGIMMPSDIYFYILKAGSFRITRKMVLMK